MCEKSQSYTLPVRYGIRWYAESSRMEERTTMRGLVKRAPEPDRVRSDVQQHQEPFAVVAPTVVAALWMGAAGGFVLASALSVTLAMRVPLGLWWLALAQAHGHIQLYGWAGLFVLGIALHFVP